MADEQTKSVVFVAVASDGAQAGFLEVGDPVPFGLLAEAEFVDDFA
jgi:hypothetical protein